MHAPDTNVYSLDHVEGLHQVPAEYTQEQPDQDACNSQHIASQAVHSHQLSPVVPPDLHTAINDPADWYIRSGSWEPSVLLWQAPAAVGL